MEARQIQRWKQVSIQLAETNTKKEMGAWSPCSKLECARIHLYHYIILVGSVTPENPVSLIVHH